MISLKDYALEKLLINENSFSSADYNKHDYKYIIGVINDILSNKTIILGKENKGPFKYLKLKLNNNIINILKDFDPSKNNPESFNKIFNELKNSEFTVYDNKELTSESSNQNIKNLWGKIWKGPYSGKVAAGASDGQIFESLVCYLFNYGDSANIDEWIKKFNVAKNVNTDKWIESSIHSAELLKTEMNLSNSQYTAFHVDGNDLFKKKINEKQKQLASLFSGKEKIKNVLGLNLADLYAGDKKDKWNPADIVIIKNLSDKEYDNILASLKSVENDSIAFNVKLASYSVSENTPAIILPISLKMISKNTGNVYGHNIKTAKLIDEHTFDNIGIKLGEKYETDKTTGNMLAIGFLSDKKECEIQIRRQSGTGDNLSIEAKLAENKLARGGKGITIIKQRLNINDNSYQKQFTDDDNLFNWLNKMSTYGCVDDNKNIFPNKCPEKLRNNNLYKRTCYKGFAGLFEIFIKKNPDIKTENYMYEFVKFLWESCVECPGSYYIIK